MPLPKPTSMENEEKFMQRCMIDNVMVNEYPRIDQRRAICYVQWKERGK